MPAAGDSQNNALFDTLEPRDPTPGGEPVTLRVGNSIKERRIDKYLHGRFSNFSRRFLKDAIKADSVHYKTDLLTNIATIAAIMLAVVGWTQADALFGLGIAVYILWSAFHIGFGAAQHLMDHELPEDAQQKIIDIVLTHPEVRGVHELRTRQSGQTPFIQLHIELDGNMRLSQAHHIGDDVEVMIKKAMPGADVLIHQDADDDSPPDHPGGRVQPSGASRPYSDAGVDLSEEKKSRED